MKLNYPIKFKPILKEKIWGGEKLSTTFKKETNKTNIGESWEVSDIEGSVSVVANGELKGQSLKQLVKNYKGNFVGNKVFNQFGEEFPLLIKIIDAKKPLSIQVHPNNKLAQERHNSFGKNEMWYIMDCDKDAELIIGFNKKVTQNEYVSALKKGTILDILNTEKISRGDTFYIPTGRVHAIGAGTVLAEIQQTSDITYRIYDYERKNAKGNKRKLHNELAVDAIDYQKYDSYKINYTSSLNKSSKLIHTPYFKTNIIKITHAIEMNYSDLDSFVICICVEGSFIIDVNSYTLQVHKGETILLPATIKKCKLTANNATILEVYL
jgi:mannose-6-phosphate isomerase